jgi:hypothetical protein
MKKLAILLGLKEKYRIKPVTVGVRTRYQIQKTTFGFLWSTVINPLIVTPESPYQFKSLPQAEAKLSELQKS